MKNWKKILSLLLAAVLCLTLLASCAKSEDTTGDDAQNEQTETPEDGETPEESETPEDGETMFEDTEIVLYMIDTNPDSEDVAAFNEALNEMTMQKLGITVDVVCFSIGDYATQLSLALTSGDTVDLAMISPMGAATFSSLVSNAQCLPLDDLLTEYGQGILAELGEYINAGKVGGQTYAVTVWRQKGSSLSFEYNTAVAEELGLVDAIENAESFDDLRAVLEAVQQTYPDMYGIGGQRILNVSNFLMGSGSFDDIGVYDNLGDSLEIIYLDAADDTVKILQENEQHIAMYQMFADWMEAGLVYPDTMTNQELGAPQLMGDSIIFGSFAGTELGAEATASQQAGIDISVRDICSGLLATKSFNTFATIIPVTAQEPEAGMAFLNLLYTDPEAMNLMLYGVEGENYVVKDGVAYPPEGTDVTTCGWHIDDFWIGNSFLALPWEGTSADYRELARADIETRTPSTALGFTLDTTDMSDLIGALTAVSEQYTYPLRSGLYTESMLAEYLDALDSAGINEYVAEIQAQLDAWRDTQ